MILATIYNYLDGALPDPVYTERPKVPPVRYHLLELTGRKSEDGHLYAVTIAAQSYADSLAECNAMSDQLVEAMQGAVILDDVAAVDLNSQYNFTDPSTAQRRYQAVFDLITY